MLSRIDAASEEPRRTLKVASVVGRVFLAPTLPGAYDDLGSLETVAANLEALRALDLVALDRAAEQAWMFKHMVTQEVAYESLPFALRAILHGRVGDYIERTEAHDLERVVPLLEHHYWRSDQDAKKLEYLRKAAAAAEASYANNAAIAYFDRLIPLLDGEERLTEMLKLAQVLQLVGEVQRAMQVSADAREVAIGLDDPAAVARCDHSLAESARRLGQFDEAAELLTRAREGFTSVGDEAGVADVLQITGTVSAQRGDLPTARARYLDSLEIRERLSDQAGIAALTNNLGIVALHTGELDLARRFGERALALYTELGDRRRICACEINLSMVDVAADDHEAALRHTDEAIRLAGEVGDRLHLAIAQNNRGDALRDLGRLEAAGDAYAVAVRAYRDLNDMWPMLALLEDIAMLAARSGRPVEALWLLGAADTLRSTVGSARSTSDEERVMAGLESARAALGEARADDAREHGRSLTQEHAIELALSVSQAAVQ